VELKKVEPINPKHIVHIHTFNGSDYHRFFSVPVVEMKDGDAIQL